MAKPLEQIGMIFLLIILTILNFCTFIYSLPAIPAISKAFLVSRSMSQSLISVALLGTVVSYLFSGPLSDTIGSKKVLIMLMGFYLSGNLICATSQNIYFMFFGYFLIGASSFLSIFLKYMKNAIKGNIMRLFSFISIFANLVLAAMPVMMGYVVHTTSWRYVFIIMALLNLACFICLLFLPRIKDEQLTTFNIKILLKRYLFFLTHPYYLKQVVAFSSISAGVYVFYILSPHVFITDFSLSPTTFGLFFSLTIFGQVFGNILDIFMSKFFNHGFVIFFSQIMAIITIFTLIVLYYIFPNPYVLIIFISIFMASYSLCTNAREEVMTLKPHLAGLAGGLFAIIINSLNGASGIIASRQDGEQMATLMFGFLLIGILINLFAARKKVES